MASHNLKEQARETTMSTSLLSVRTNDDEDTTEPITHSDLSEVIDRLRAMRNQEDTTYNKKEYGSRSNSNEDDEDDEDRRLMMCQWCYEVVDCCDFQRETVSIAFSILDRYLLSTTARGCRRRKEEDAPGGGCSYRLAVMTALYVAVKLNETCSLEVELLEALSKNAYTRKQFERMEMRMIGALGWRLNRPTPLAFLRCFVALLPPLSVDPAVAGRIIEKARYEVELAVFDESRFVHRFPSEIAVAAVVKAISEDDHGSLSKKTKADFLFAVKRSFGLPNTTNDPTVGGGGGGGGTQSDLHLLFGRETTTTHRRHKKETDSNNKNRDPLLLSAKSVTQPRPDSPVAVAEKLLV